jgi:tetratricopeptide (TPR) repeat protein
MATADPYASCPCGSGEKYKFCCQKVEKHAARCHELIENGQFDAARKAIDEGLKAVPGNSWLLTHKALLLLDDGQKTEGLAILREVVRDHPGNRTAQTALIQELGVADQSIEMAAQFQAALDHVSADQRAPLLSLATQVGSFLARAGQIPAAIKHLDLALSFHREDPVESTRTRDLLRSLLSSPGLSLWLRNPYALHPAPEGLAEPEKKAFQSAIELANDGRWRAAAQAFETLLSSPGRLVVLRNAAICRLWFGDSDTTYRLLRQYVQEAGPTVDAIDLEGLRQIILPSRSTPKVDELHLMWTLRDRDGLLRRLRENDRVIEEGDEEIERESGSEPAFAVTAFALLDRPRPTEIPADIHAFPRIVGRALVGQELAVLETYDDGRLESLTDTFTRLAGPCIPPAQPRTRKIESVPRFELALQSTLWLPEDQTPEQQRQYRMLELRRILTEVWPDTPLPYLDGKTPREAGGDPRYRIALRASLMRLEQEQGGAARHEAVAELRALLHLEPEPELDPTGLDIRKQHVSRLRSLPLARLDDTQIEQVYALCHLFLLQSLLGAIAHEVIRRPTLLDSPRIGRVRPYRDLATVASLDEDHAQAHAWIHQGREADPDARGIHAVEWDLAQLDLLMAHEPPENWVPVLAGILELYRGKTDATSTILSTLLGLGLVQARPDPANPRRILIDTQLLENLVAQYGPRITTADGTLGISATRGGIWTPEAERAGAGQTSGGGIWTPGSGPAPTPGDKPRIILPGQ